MTIDLDHSREIKIIVFRVSLPVGYHRSTWTLIIIPGKSFGEGVIKSFFLRSLGGEVMPVTIVVSCGCGFKTTSLEEAEEHAKQTKHVLRIQGTVTPPRSK